VKKIPIHKSQIPNKFQVPNSNVQNKGAVNAIILRLSHWFIGNWCFFGAWCLGFGILFFHHPPYAVHRKPSPA
jgi:hypothetical protein